MNNYLHIEPFENQIFLYLSGKLTMDQKRDFESLLKKDSVLAQEVSFRKKLKKVINNQAILDWNETLKNVIAETPITPVAPKGLGNWKWWLLGCVMISTISYFVYSNMIYQQRITHIQELSASYLVPFENVINFDPNQVSFFNIGMQAYQEQNYKMAIQNFEQARNGIPDPSINFYLGIAYLLEKEYSKSIHELTIAANDEDDTFKTLSNWYIALAMIDLGDLEGAKSKLRLVSTEFSDFQTQSIELLSELEKK